ncbi:MAG: TraB/GumN family protein [Saprospiraceae bacterium]
MKKIIIGIFTLSILCFFTQNAFAQIDDADVQNSLLWKIEGEGIQTSYIYGTIHIISEKDFVWSDKLNGIIAETEQVVLELDMDEPTLPSEYFKYATFPDTNITLQKIMKADQYQKLSDFFKENMGADLKTLDKLKPFTLMGMMYPVLLGNKTKSYEQEFLQIAKASDKPVHGLETVQFQMSLFDNMSYDEQIGMLMDLVENPKKNKSIFEQMVIAYTSQDVELLHQFMTENMAELKKYEADFLDNRNFNWVEKMREFTQQPTFFAVGAGHLGGERGVLQLLKENGFKVTLVPLQME